MWAHSFLSLLSLSLSLSLFLSQKVEPGSQFFSKLKDRANLTIAKVWVMALMRPKFFSARPGALLPKTRQQVSCLSWLNGPSFFISRVFRQWAEATDALGDAGTQVLEGDRKLILLSSLLLGLLRHLSLLGSKRGWQPLT